MALKRVSRLAWLAGVAAVIPGSLHADEAALESVVVTAPYPRDLLDVVQVGTVIEGDSLIRSLRGTIGQTLEGQAGVSSTSFGPGASRPVLRGAQGERVRVLVDALGSIDVSNTSVDHAVAIDPLVADRIEILRGPASLLFGGSALGGLVSIGTNRIPETPIEDGMTARARGSYGRAANERSVAGVAQARLAPGFQVYVDGSFLRAGDLRIPGFAESRIQREAEGELGLEDEDDKGTLENSAVRTASGAVGAGFVGEWGHFGIAVSRFETRYGVPGKEEEGEEDEDGDFQTADSSKRPQGGGADVQIDLHQTRVDIGGRYRFASGPFEALSLRAGYADYGHVELEGDEIGTAFDNQGGEGRLELVQRSRNGWRGASGLQLSYRDFQALGEEAFVPPNTTFQLGLFTLQEWRSGPWLLEGAARFEHTRAKSDVLGISRSFETVSASAGVGYDLAEDWRIGLVASRLARAPAAEELFANGPHAATRSFEIGNPAFTSEKGWGLALNLLGRTDRWSVQASAYLNQFSSFIVEVPTGAVEDGLPVFQFTQGRARLWGAELDVSYAWVRGATWTVVTDVVADVVRGRDRDRSEPLPRIPAARVKLGAEAQSDLADVRLELEVVGRQRRIAAFELPTEGFERLNASVVLRPLGRERDIRLVVEGTNLTDQEARLHSSFLKDAAPLAGRDLRVTLHMGF